MVTLISPAKTLDLQNAELPAGTEPEFQKEIQELVSIMKKKSTKGIQKLMGVSENIASLNKERYQKFENQFTAENSRPAIFTFNGDVYRKMEVENYTLDQLNFAQEHVRILSGLYGLLKPLDRIQPYRLEMGIKLRNKKSKDLYSFWKRKITPAIDEAANGIIVNLASQEYFKAVDQKKLKSKVINISFKEFREGSYAAIGIFSKQARGLMVNHIIKNKIDSPDKLKLFSEDNYEYTEKLSGETEWVFIR